MSDRIELDSSEFRQLVVIIMQDAVERNTLANLRKYILDQENKNKFRKERFFSMDAMEYLEVVKDIMSTTNKINILAATLGINCGVVREGEFKFSIVVDSIRIDYDLDPVTRKGSIVMRDRLDEIKEIQTKAQDYIKSLVNSR